jgi:hypothetical protein
MTMMVKEKLQDYLVGMKEVLVYEALSSSVCGLKLLQGKRSMTGPATACYLYAGYMFPCIAVYAVNTCPHTAIYMQYC